ncbi:MAG TPA: hypothetical protein VG271_15060, partial [Beijerinckiaceae bacterium]|nr:hypothetical protein [Beijerinckiaceae bacterium]
AVGILLSAFGTFWFGEGAGMAWPGEDWTLVALVIGYFVAAMIAVQLCRGEMTYASYRSGERM